MKRRRIFWAAAAILAVLTLLFTMPRAGAPREEDTAREEAGASDARLTAQDAGSRAEADCQVIQTMRFSRCGHAVTRRISAPDAVVGRDFAQAQDYYDLWSILSFTPHQIDMEREIDLFCPMHWVLTSNEAGQIVLSRNRYGDGMAVERTLDGVHLDQFSPDTQDQLRQGLSFDSEADAEAFLARER